MVTIPAKVKERLTQGLKKFVPVLQKAKDKDINESDTVTIIADMLSDVFGYDKYSEITSEFAVKKTYCDLALRINGDVHLLVEIKAAGLDLKDDFVKQACDYGSNAGIDWVVLTNGIFWKVFKIVFSKPIEAELIYEFDFLSLSAKKTSDLEMLFYLTRESLSKASNNSLQEYAEQRQVLNHFFIGQLLLTEPMLEAIRKQIRKISPDAKISADEIGDILTNAVIKRDVFEGERSEDAKKRLQKYARQLAKEQATKEQASKEKSEPPQQ